MLHFLLLSAIGAAIRRAQQQPPALDVPQWPGDQMNAVGAPQPIAPVALADRFVPGPSPAQMARGLPTSLGPLPPLSLLTEFDFVMDTPGNGSIEPVQVDPMQNRIGYGPIR
jgi:hypothetical protein